MSKIKKTKYILIYDVNTVPENSTMSKVLSQFVRDKVLLYDGSKGNSPVVNTVYEEYIPKNYNSSDSSSKH